MTNISRSHQEARRAIIDSAYLSTSIRTYSRLEKSKKRWQTHSACRLRSNRAPTRTRGFLIASPPPTPEKRARAHDGLAYSLTTRETLSAPLQFLRVSSRHIFAAYFFWRGAGSELRARRSQSAIAGDRAMCIPSSTLIHCQILHIRRWHERHVLNSNFYLFLIIG